MKKRVDTVDTVDEFHNLDPIEKMWWIQYSKLKKIWQELYPLKEFPVELMDGPLLDKPWKDPSHYLNYKLNIAKKEIESQMPDWERIQDYVKQIIFCGYDGVSCTCQDCKSRFKCELRGD